MKPLILITNDDGIYSPGLWAVAEAVQHLGDLLIVAPMQQQTSMGRSFPKGEDVGIIEEVRICLNGISTLAYGVHGSPAHAVAYGVLELADRKPDLCISGINYGENLGLSLTCSGTLGAAFEAGSHGIPSIAISLQVELAFQHSSDYPEMDWEACKKILAIIATDCLTDGFPKGVSILNVNIPQSATSTSEIRQTRQSRLNYSVFIKPEKRDYKQAYRLESKLDVELNRTEKNSDIYAVYYDKVVSLTPLTWDLSVTIDWDKHNKK